MNTNDFLDIATNICLDSLSDEEILWYKFSSKLGFNPHGLHNIIKNKETNSCYKIMGLIWRYSRINVSDSNNIIDDELYVHLKFYKEEKPKVIEKKEENQNDVIGKYVPSNSLVVDVGNYLAIADSSSMFQHCSTFDPLSLNKPHKNEKIDYSEGIFLSLNEFVTQYEVDNIIKEKKDFFKLKYTIGVAWT